TNNTYRSKVVDIYLYGIMDRSSDKRDWSTVKFCSMVGCNGAIGISFKITNKCIRAMFERHAVLGTSYRDVLNVARFCTSGVLGQVVNHIYMIEGEPDDTPEAIVEAVK